MDYSLQCVKKTRRSMAMATNLNNNNATQVKKKNWHLHKMYREIKYQKKLWRNKFMKKLANKKQKMWERKNGKKDEIVVVYEQGKKKTTKNLCKNLHQ
jgi:hypothetical protein